MRPVNLIPVDERRGASRARPKGGGKGAYVVLGVLGALVLGVFVLTSTNNQINEHKSKKAELDKQAAQAEGVAQKFAAYGDTQTAAQQRFDAVYGVVKGRFDFERRLRQLTHVIPDDVTIDTLKATLDAGAGGGGSGAAGGGPGSAGESGGEEGEGRSQIPGPAFEMSACTSSGGWPSVAVMITRMRNIDGVTKILAGKPSRSDSSGDAAGGDAAGGAEGGGCSAGGITFDLVVGFEAPAESVPASSDPAGSARTATQQAQGAAQTADQANATAGSDQSGGGTAP
ncbi:MAG: hypothetical protein WDZ37_00030 [Solirubrobacterales bacterium]